MEKSLRHFDGFRGAWLGFNRGFYKKSPGSDLELNCLNSDYRTKWIQAQSVKLGMAGLSEDIDWLTAFGDFVQIMGNLVDCEFRAPIKDIKNFCSSSAEDQNLTPEDAEFDDLTPEDPCAFSVILENFTKNAFALMAKSSELAETFKAFPSDNPETLMAQTMTLGEDMGTFLRVGLDF